LALDDDIRIMREVPMLSEVPRDGLRLLAFSAESRILRKGDVLFREGEPADGGYIVASGSLDIGRGEGPPQRIAHRGTMLCGLALLCETEQTATATAREPSQVLRISRSLFMRMLDEYPGVAARLHTQLAQRVLAGAGELAELGREFGRPMSPRRAD
jgi:CRP-like cAMP-binding protein